MSWRCACLYSLPIAVVYVVSFFLPAWEDHDGTYVGYETLSFGFLKIAADPVPSLCLLFPNVLVVAGIVLLAVPKTWARIVASLCGFFALMSSLLGTQFVGIVLAITNSVPGPTAVLEGYFCWTGSMLLLLLIGMITAVVSGTRPDRSFVVQRSPESRG